MFCCKAINILVVFSLICTTSFASVYNFNPKNKNKEDLRDLAQKVLNNKVHSELAVELFSQLERNFIGKNFLKGLGYYQLMLV